MAKKSDESTKVAALRRQAEEALRATRRDVAAMPAKDVQQLVHELQVHQIELDMQNEELRRTQLELEAARDRYRDLYDFSPAGHLTLNIQGKVVEANLRAGTMLGIDRKKLIGQPLALLIASDDQDSFRRHCQDVMKTGTRQVCELHLHETSGASCCIYLESLALQEESGPLTHWRTAMLDISERKQGEQKLTSQQAQLEGIISSAMDAIITVDEDERVVVFNRAAESMFLCPIADAMGQPFDRFIPERFRQAHHGHMSIFSQTQTTSRSMGQHGGLFGLRANGEEFPIDASISQIQVGKKSLLTVILRDITERRQAETAMLSSKMFIRDVLNSLSAHICVLDRNGVILKTNDAWNEFARCNANRGVSSLGVGQNYLDVCRHAIAGGQSTAQIILKGVEAVLAGSEPYFTQEYACHSPQEKRWFLMRVTPLKDTKGVVIAHTDISGQIQVGLALEEHVCLLKEKQTEMEYLAGKLIVGQEEERKRIARDLHDDFNQRLAALSVELESMERATPTPAGLPARQLAEVRSQVVQLSDDLHDLAYKLHPSLLEHVGLEVAVRDHVAEFAKRTGLPATFTAREAPKTLSSEVATNLFRVMQESLQNVSKHAQATEVTVKLSGSSKGVGVSVRDNGKGFDLENMNARLKGLGLVSMQERVRGQGGFLRIHSLPRAGTKVCAWIPHPQERA
mgnify:CR=1 FL=1